VLVRVSIAWFLYDLLIVLSDRDRRRDRCSCPSLASGAIDFLSRRKVTDDLLLSYCTLHSSEQ